MLDHTRDLFNSPVVDSARDQETTEESDPIDEPNTKDRRFIKDDGEDESDGEYVLTDPGEFSSESDEKSYERTGRAARNEDFYSLETKHEA